MESDPVGVKRVDVVLILAARAGFRSAVEQPLPGSATPENVDAEPEQTAETASSE